MAVAGVACEAVENEGWGLMTEIVLPGGSMIGVYESHHKSLQRYQNEEVKSS